MSKTNQTAAVVNYNLEEMIAYIRQNPDIALDVHQHLTQVPYLQQLNDPIEASTPQTAKRNLDSSDNDGAQISKQQRILSNGKQKNTNQMNVSLASNYAHQSDNNPAVFQPQQQPSNQQQHRLPFAQLKRAVSSNLPCFLIEYDQDGNLKNRPSDVLAASIVENHFKQQGILIVFSLVGHTGNKLKLGVNNKESYPTLISTGKWPLQINNINITVIKPKFIPDSFALVVRYVPLQYNDEYVKDEIERNLQSTENVRHLQEYNSALKLGRISIGNTFCTITPFLAGNRMTYCTRCWCLGHMRDKCEMEHQRCRICLDNIVNGQTHNCSNIPRCAQCNGDHHSLSSVCEKVAEYRSELKEQVNNAISSGKLQRLVPQDHPQPMQFQMQQNDFPSLPSQTPGATPWKLASAQPPKITNMNGSDDTAKMLLSAKDEKLVDKVLTEWFTAGTLENILTKWENITPKEIEKEQTPLNILGYNVQGWGSRSLEVIDIVLKVDASICVFTEVGELWNTSRIPHFNIFHQQGTNKSGGVCVAIGKHLRGSRIDFSGENTVIVDVSGFSELVRIIAIYWPADRRTYVNFGKSKSKIFYTHVGLPQGSSLSPYLFIVYHWDLISCLGTHSSHIFADDLSVLITPPIRREFKPMIKFLEEEEQKYVTK
ncbi:unnamed protein product [Rotaria sordida]|uniref:Reverse transcriptase domain-containing protein n=1 Tax=Rotaria sordida TaxID=392033 RepID=A0A815GE24_9BILA|nr:unnamed protein product [Rotaria sordida]CAF1594961.1 unnamed protein product [Rotaria sordida]